MKGYTHLTYEDRYTIEKCLKRNMAIRAIARILGRSASVISREVRRGMCEQMDSFGVVKLKYDSYYAQRAHEIACENKGRPVKIAHDHATANRLEHLIKKERYSPYAALERMKQEGSLGTDLSVNTVYNYIRKGVLDIEEKHLVYGFTKRKPKKEEFADRPDLPHKNGGKSIKNRPISVLKREEFGHWEADLVVSSRPGKSAVFTLVERKTRMLFAVKIRRKTQAEVIRALNKIELCFGKEADRVFKSVTYDNGLEFNDARRMMRSAVKKGNRISEVYYAHPYCSSERGTNENTNRMLRRFIPKNKNMDYVSNEDVQNYVYWINSYPRAKLNGASAAEAFEAEMSNLGLTCKAVA